MIKNGKVDTRERINCFVPSSQETVIAKTMATSKTCKHLWKMQSILTMELSCVRVLISLLGDIIRLLLIRTLRCKCKCLSFRDSKIKRLSSSEYGWGLFSLWTFSCLHWNVYIMCDEMDICVRLLSFLFVKDPIRSTVRLPIGLLLRGLWKECHFESDTFEGWK